MRRTHLRRARLLLGALGALSVLGALSGCAASENEGERPMAERVSVTDLRVPGPAPHAPGSAAVPVRVYTPDWGPGSEPAGAPWATLVWAHGGSFVRGTLDWPEADWVARSFAAAGMRVVSVDYVLASETVKAPAPSNDVAAAVAWAGNEYDGALVVGGASAGAHLAVLATLAQHDAAPGRAADALLLEYPTLHRVQRDDAAIAARVAGLPEQRRFRADRIADMYRFYLGDSGAPVAGELGPARLSDLPPTVMVHAEADELRASGEEFGEQLRAAGVSVAEHVEPGTEHGYLNRPEESERAGRQAAATIDRFVRELRAILPSD